MRVRANLGGMYAATRSQMGSHRLSSASHTQFSFRRTLRPRETGASSVYLVGVRVRAGVRVRVRVRVRGRVSVRGRVRGRGRGRGRGGVRGGGEGRAGEGGLLRPRL